MESCFSPNSLEILNDVRSKGEFCDAVLMTKDGGLFKIHKCILGAHSPYFTSLFIENEGRDSQNMFLLPDIKKETLQVLIDYAYGISPNLVSENIHDVYIAAGKLNMKKLLQKCCSFLINNLNLQNSIWVEKLAKGSQCKELEEAAQEYIMKYFEDIAEKCPDFINLTIEELLPILSSERLNVKNEEVAWNVMLRWINVDPVNRKEHIFHLMKCIRLGLMNVEFFMINVINHPFITATEDCQRLVIETLKCFNEIRTTNRKPGEFLTPRLPHEIVFAIGGWNEDAPTNYIETYDCKADRWIQMRHVSPLGVRAYHGCAIILPHIYIIGGFNGIDYFNGCACFNIFTKEWKNIAPMHCKRCYVSVAVLDDTIYAMGGYNGLYRQNTAEKYDYQENQWKMIAPMNMQRSDSDSTTLNGYIYIVGGFTGTECLHSAEMYSPLTNQWTIIMPMQSQRCGVSCVAYKGYIYALGGFNGNYRINTVEKYNPVLNVWSDVPSMFISRSNFCTAIVNDMIFAIGGYNGSTTISYVECYEESSNKWSIVADMSISRSALASCVVQGIENIRDYIYKRRDWL